MGTDREFCYDSRIEVVSINLSKIIDRYDPLANAKPRISVSVVLAFMLALSVGCASKDAAVSRITESRQIVDIVIDENPDSLILEIRGNQNLTHKEYGQVYPKKIVLFFPATSLNGVKGRFFPPGNELIRTITTNDHVETGPTNSTIYIALKLASPYTVTSDGEKLQVIFLKNSTVPKKITPPPEPAATKLEPQPVKPVQKSVPVATALRTVTTEAFENSVAVNVKMIEPT